MWIFTSSGFVSAVQDWNDNNLVLVRARDHSSLEPLAVAASVEIATTPDADYPYRVSVTKDAFATWVSVQAAAIDYPNFKSEVAVSRGAVFARVLGKVWDVLHGVEDVSARHRPAPSIPRESALPDNTVRPFTIKRIQRPHPANGAVLPDTTAVISFGNPNTARIATLGINPSHTEFNNSNLARLSGLDVNGPQELSEEQAKQVALACYGYFSNSSTHTWFKDMQDYVVKPCGASYFDSTACHLDLTPWATKPVWSGLTAEVRAELLEADADFLSEQLREHSFRALLVNGRQALDVFQEEFIELEPVFAIQLTGGKKSIVRAGHLGETAVVGWGINVPDSHTPVPAKEQLASFLRDWFGNEL